MATVLGPLDSHLLELRNFRANELLFRERHSNKMKPGRGASPGYMSPCSRRGMNCESQVKSASGPSQNSPGKVSPRITTVPESQFSPTSRRSSITGESHLKTVCWNSPGRMNPRIPTTECQVKSATAGATPASPTTPTAQAVELRGTNKHSRERVVAQQSPMDEGIHVTNSTTTAVPSLDGATLQTLAKMVVREMRGVKKVPIHLDDFTGAKSPYLAEDAMVWLKKLRLAARQNEWDSAQALEVASIHLKGLAARWFASIEKHLNEELHLDEDRLDYFEAQFKERFADFRSRLLQIEKIKDMKLRDGEDVREFAEAVMSMNWRLDEPLDDEFLRWVFIQGLPPSELRDKLYNLEELPATFASAVNYARRFQLSRTVFSIKNSLRKTDSGSSSARPVRSN